MKNCCQSFWLPIAGPTLKTPADEIVYWHVSLLAVFAIFLLPAGFGFCWAWLRIYKLHRQFGIDHPTPRGWDYFVKNNGTFFVIFHLKGNKKIGGYFGQKSFASTFPQEPEIFVEILYHLDDECTFTNEVPGTAGGVFRGAEWEWIEFFEVLPDENDNEREERRSDTAIGVRDGGQGGMATAGATRAEG